MPEVPTPRELEAEVLLRIAGLRLLRSSDVRLLTGMPKDDVRRALDALRRHGWTERVTVRSPEHRDPLELHTLREVAVPAFAQAFGLDEAEVRRSWPVERRDLLDHITSVEITLGLNRFLARIANGYIGETTKVAGLRLLPRDRRGADCWWPRLMDAYGCLRGNDDFPFFVAWDRPRTPKVHRSARVRAWYDAWDGRAWPTVLIVCPSGSARRQWEAAIRNVANRRGEERLEVAFIRTRDALGQDPTDRYWRLPGEDYQESLWGVLQPVANRPFREARRPRLDVIDRGVDIPSQPLHEWAQGVLARARVSARERIAAQVLTLESRHREALVHLARHPYLTERDLALTFGEEDEQVLRLLADLDRYGLTGSLARELAWP